MARIRVIGKKEAPIVKRHTIGQKLYSGLKSIGQKVVDNRYAIGSIFAAAAVAAASNKNQEKDWFDRGEKFPNVPGGNQLTPAKRI